jgi:hypothetical protein
MREYDTRFISSSVIRKEKTNEITTDPVYSSVILTRDACENFGNKEATSKIREGYIGKTLKRIWRK